MILSFLLNRVLYKVVIYLFIITGCSVGPNFHQAISIQTTHYTETNLPSSTVNLQTNNSGTQKFKFAEDVPSQWWQLFHCHSLNQLIKRGIKNNPNLQVAQSSLVQSQEILRASANNLLMPSLTIDLSPMRQRTTGAQFGNAKTSPIVFNLFSTQLNFSYSLDLFGGARNQLKAYKAQVDYQKYNFEAVYLTLTSNIVSTVITEAFLREQINITKKIIHSYLRTLKIAKAQFKLGVISLEEIYINESELAKAKATLPILEKQLSITRNLLSFLVGSIPGERNLPNISLNCLRLPANLPVSLPSQLAKQRPDIKGAEALLQVASSEVGVATANLFPQIVLTGSYGFAANNTATLFSLDNNIWNFGGKILQPILNRASLKASQRAAIAAYEKAQAQYKHIVNQAFQNVADALRNIELDALILKRQIENELFLRKSYDLTKKNYQLGATDLLHILTVERQYQLATINRLHVETSRYLNTVSLFQSLGGGWWNRKTNMHLKEN